MRTVDFARRAQTAEGQRAGIPIVIAITDFELGFCDSSSPSTLDGDG